MLVTVLSENIPGLIVETRTSVREIDEVYDFYKKGIMKSPRYQRNPSVWIKRQEQELLKTILERKHLPQIVAQVYEEHEMIKFNVIEGHQRIETICKFIDNILSIDKKYDELNGGKTFRDLDDTLKANFLSYPLTFLEMKTNNDQIAKDYYVQSNTMGTKLNSPEIRHARFDGGEFHQTVKEYAQRFEKFYLDNGILKEGHIKRMFNQEITAEVMVLVLRGPQSSGRTLDGFYESYSSSFSDKKKAISRMKAAISMVSRLFPHKLKGTNFDSLTNYYSLVGAIDKTTTDCIIEPKNYKKLSKDIMAFMRKVITEKDESSDADVKTYWASTQEGTRSKKNRTTRIDILAKIFWRYAIPKDNRRNFTESQRREIWNRSYDKKCGYCHRKVERYEDYWPDHKKSHSKGGPTTVDNGQVTHEYCNRQKSNN